MLELLANTDVRSTPWRFAYAVMPILSIVRMSRVVRLRRTKRFSSGTQMRRSCTLMCCQRLVLMFECETFCASSLRLPVMSLFAMGNPPFGACSPA